jgi:hypothetical protein
MLSGRAGHWRGDCSTGAGDVCFVRACGFSSIIFFQEMILKMILSYPFSFQSPAEFDALSDEVNDQWAHGAPAPTMD